MTPEQQLEACPFCGTANDQRATRCSNCQCDLPRAASKADGIAAIARNVGALLMLGVVLLVLVVILLIVF